MAKQKTRVGKLRGVGHFLLGLLASVVVFEGYVRLVEATPLWRVLPVPEVSLFAPDAAAGYTHRAGASGIWTTENRAWIEINALGLRDRLGRTAEKGNGAERWIVAGDSMVESVQVPLEATFAFLAEEALTSARGAPVEVINMGLSGATPAVVAERVRTRGAALSPDGVIVMISAADLEKSTPDEASAFAGFVSDGKGGATVSHAFRETRGYQFRTSFAGEAFYWLLDHSRVALVFNDRKNQGLFAELVVAQAAPKRGGSVVSHDCQSERIAKLLQAFSTTGEGFGPARVSALLGSLQEASEVGGFRAVLALRDLPDCTSQPGKAATLRAQVAARVRGFGLRFVDMTKLVRKNLPEGTEMPALHGFKARIGGGHLNETGHRVYAEALEEIIQRVSR